jgi:hypothetical protein
MICSCHELRTQTQETGFFAESAGNNEILSQKPGFWAPVS